MTREDITLVVALFGVIFGSIGSVLGILNYVRAMQRDKTCLKLFPAQVWEKDQGYFLAVEIVNVSLFPVTVSEVSFVLDPDRKQFRNSISFRKRGGVEFPIRIESRASIVATSAPAHQIPDFHRIIGIEAKTACRHSFTVGQKLIRPIVKGIMKCSLAGENEGFQVTKATSDPSQ